MTQLELALAGSSNMAAKEPPQVPVRFLTPTSLARKLAVPLRGAAGSSRKMLRSRRSIVMSSAYEWQPLSEDWALPHDTTRSRALPVGCLWFVTSAIFSTYANTAFLRELRSPTLHALVRFTTSALVGIGTSPSLKLSHVPSLCASLWLPATFLLLANLLNSVALQRSSITLSLSLSLPLPLTRLRCSSRA